jgi:hypothetical protein
VFAHRVILEGALVIVDEEKEFLRQRQLERGDERGRAVRPWDAHRHRESTSSTLRQSASHPLNFWSSTSSFSSLPDDAGSSGAPSSSARQSDPTFISPPLSSSILLRSAQTQRENTPPSAMNSVPALTSPMRNLSIDLSSSPSSRHKAGRLSQERPRTPGSVAIGAPPPALTGKRSHSPSRWERKVDCEGSADGHEQENGGALLVGGQDLTAQRPSVKRKLRSDDFVDANAGPCAKFGAAAGMTALDR